MSFLLAAAWIAPPLALVLELVAARRAVVRNEKLAEAWLAAGARPLEVMSRIRGRLRPGIVIALALIVPALIRPANTPAAPVLWGLAGIAAAVLVASILASLRSFVDLRLVDRAPVEARSPFRLRPYERPLTVEVYESRPPQDGSP